MLAINYINLEDHLLYIMPYTCISKKNKNTYIIYVNDYQWFSLVGTLLWLWVGLQWKDRALTVLNSVLVFVLGAGLLRALLG